MKKSRLFIDDSHAAGTDLPEYLPSTDELVSCLSDIDPSVRSNAANAGTREPTPAVPIFGQPSRTADSVATSGRKAACPRVSIVMAVHNGETLIRKAIESALAQTEQSLELIVVDDGSTDGTRAAVDHYRKQDPRVRLIAGRTRRGPGHARNRGIDAAKGEWIAVLDADDWYSKERLEILLAAADRHGASLLADNQLFVRDDGSRPHRRLIRASKGKPRRLTTSGLLRNDKIGRTGNFGLLKPIVRRQALIAHGIRYNEEITLGEDFYFLLDCLRRMETLLLIPEPHYFYRIHRASISSSPAVETLIPMLKAQRVHTRQFDPALQPETRQLMHERTNDLERYIRYKTLMERLAFGDLRGASERIAKDPGTLFLLARGVARFLERQSAIYWARFLTVL